MHFPLEYSNEVVVGAGRVFAIVDYEGSAYHGWQAQKSGLPSIQAALESALSRVANSNIEVVCAGRTDAGVHSSYQVVHFDTVVERSLRSWVFGTNSNLPDDIKMHWVDNISAEFSARFSATARRYRYFIYNGAVKPAHQHGRITWCYQPIDTERMHCAAQALVGENDFSSFRSIHCQSNTPWRNIFDISVTRRQWLVEINICANAFLHHMVRNIVGVLLDVGSGEKPVEWVAEVLAERDRKKASVTAKPHGLYLCDVTYPDAFSIPKLPLQPFFQY